MNVLIIKNNNDSFEKKVSSWFTGSGCFVESYPANHSGIKKRLDYIKTLIQIKRKYSKKIKKVIIFDNSCLYFYSLFFFSNCYLWIWNTIPQKNIERIRLLICNIKRRVYSFDKKDCNDFNLKNNSQFLPNEEKGSTSNGFVYFVGLDKGRYDLINKIAKYCKANYIDSFIQIIPDNEREYYNPEICTDSFVDYGEVLKNVSNCCAVLDICKNGQIGMTYRAIEAVFYDKKIITNNPQYKELPFYSKESIYIIENENFDGLLDFISAPEIVFDSEIKEYYCIENWIKRFV